MRAVPPQAHTGRSLRTTLSLISLILGLAASGFGLFSVLSDDETTDSPNAGVLQGPSDVVTQSPGTVDGGQTPIAETTICTNDVHGFEVAYPSDWFTSARRPKEECRFFNPEPFQITGSVNALEVAVVIFPINVDYASWVDAYEQGNNDIEIISRSETEVDGHRAAITEYLFKGDSDAGTIYSYDIDFDGVLIAATHSEYSSDYATAKAVLDEMIATLRFR